MLASQRKKLTSSGGGICNAVNTRHDRARTQKTTKPPRSADASTERALLLHFYFATPSFLAQTDSFFTRRSQPRSNVILIMRRADSNFQGEVGTNSKRSGKKSGEATDEGRNYIPLVSHAKPRLSCGLRAGIATIEGLIRHTSRDRLMYLLTYHLINDWMFAKLTWLRHTKVGKTSMSLPGALGLCEQRNHII